MQCRYVKAGEPDCNHKTRCQLNTACIYLKPESRHDSVGRVICEGCNEASQAVVHVRDNGRVLCANCDIKVNRGIATPRQCEPLASGILAIG